MEAFREHYVQEPYELKSATCQISAMMCPLLFFNALGRDRFLYQIPCCIFCQHFHLDYGRRPFIFHNLFKMRASNIPSRKRCRGRSVTEILVIFFCVGITTVVATGSKVQSTISPPPPPQPLSEQKTTLIDKNDSQDSHTSQELQRVVAAKLTALTPERESVGEKAEKSKSPLRPPPPPPPPKISLIKTTIPPPPPPRGENGGTTNIEKKSPENMSLGASAVDTRKVNHPKILPSNVKNKEGINRNIEEARSLDVPITPIMQPQTKQTQTLQVAQKQGQYQHQPIMQHALIHRTVPSQRESSPRTQQKAVVSNGGMQARSLLKSIWDNVEKGLDELSNIEDGITKRAQRMVTSTSSLSYGGPHQKLSSQSIPRRRENQIRSVSKSNVRTVPTQSDASPFAHMRKKYQNLPSNSKVTVRHVAWNELMEGNKMIRAKGGASTPYGQNPPLPPPPQDIQKEQSQPQQQQKQTPIQDDESRQPSSYGTNPYVQSGNLQRPPQQKKTDSYNRESRIPWDTSSRAIPSQRDPFSNLEDMPMVGSDASLIERLLPRLPRLPNLGKALRFRRKTYHYDGMDAWKDDDEDAKKGLFSFFRGKRSKQQLPNRKSYHSSDSVESMSPPIARLVERSSNGKSASLLSVSEERQSRMIGRYHATFDFVCVIFLILGMQQISGLNSIFIDTSFADLISNTLPQLMSSLRQALDTWAPFCFAYAYLTMVTKNIFLAPKKYQVASSAASIVQEDSLYAQLYLRLVAALPIDPNLPSKMAETATAQITSLIAASRLNSFVFLTSSLLLVMTVSVLRPMLMTIRTTIMNFLMLEELRAWPLDISALLSQSRVLFQSLFVSLENLASNVLRRVLDNPLDIAFHLSIFGSLLLSTLIPKMERNVSIAIDDQDDDVVENEVSQETVEQISKLGASSASRLTMLSENGSVENALERWRTARSPSMEVEVANRVPISALLRLAGYSLLSAFITLAPILVSSFVSGVSSTESALTGFQWDSVMNVSVVLLFVLFLVNDALKGAVISIGASPSVKSFLSTFSKTVKEVQESNKQQTDIKFMASVSPTAGLLVRDLWAAYTSKRAWAVRGASLQCGSGEILAVLGDDGSGKTRMLTTIAESLVYPPKRSLTSNKVRGLIAVGGLDSSKWDRRLLRRRLGILLSDVRTFGDTATLFSGSTLEEILEPVDGIRPTSRTLNSSEKGSIMLGLKVRQKYEVLCLSLSCLLIFSYLFY